MQNDYKLKLLIHHNKNNFCLHNPEMPKTKINLQKKFCLCCHRTNHSISACFKKLRDGEDKREAYARSKYPQTLFVQNFCSPSNDRTKRYDTRYRSRSTSRNNSYNKNNNAKTDIVLHLEIDLVMTKVLLLHTTIDHDVTTINGTRDLIALLINRHTNHHIDVTIVTDTNPAHMQGITAVLQNIHLLPGHLREPEILGFPDLAHTPIQEKNLIHFNHKAKMTM